MALPSVLRQLTQFLLTASCPVCHRPAKDVLCTGCHRQLLTYQWSANHPGERPKPGRVAPTTSQVTLSVFAWGQYRGVLKQALRLLKYGDRAELGFWLGCQLGKHWQSNRMHDHCQRPVVVPIPLHQQRLQQRGYNQAALIAQGFCRVTGLSLAKHGLVRTRATNAMYDLGVKERQANLIEAFQLGRGLPPTSRSILLIDDIYTTGTTALAAADPLIQAGYTIAGIATVARAVLVSP